MPIFKPIDEAIEYGFVYDLLSPYLSSVFFWSFPFLCFYLHLVLFLWHPALATRQFSHLLGILLSQCVLWYDLGLI